MAAASPGMQTGEIHLRDPFVLPVAETGTYWLFGTTDANCWKGPGTGFDAYCSPDLHTWEGPFPAFRPPAGFWGETQFWAPEVHAYSGRYYMFASFKGSGRTRGTQVLVADRPEGPYLPWSDGAVTPTGWECLDATLHLAADGQPWMVYCHEWLQVGDGRMYAQRLRADLRAAEGEPIELFRASAVPWARRLAKIQPADVPDATAIDWAHGCYITDGPYLHRTASGALLMLWSSIGDGGYSMGLARSGSGTIEGPWTQDPVPLWSEQGGHGMIFRRFDGQLMLTLHQPNRTPDERPIFRPLIEDGGTLRLA